MCLPGCILRQRLGCRCPYRWDGPSSARQLQPPPPPAPPRTCLAPTARARRGAQEVWERAARLLGRVAHLGAASAAVRAAGGIPALLRLLQRPGQAAPGAGEGAGAGAGAGASAGAPERVALAVAEAMTVLCAGHEVNQDAVRCGSLPHSVRSVACAVCWGRVG